MPIGELVENRGLATQVLRRCESMGLVIPHRTSTGHRAYGLADRYRVAAIVLAKTACTCSEDVRALTIVGTSPGRKMVLQHQHDALSWRIAGAQAALALIDDALGRRQRDLAYSSDFGTVLAERVKRRPSGTGSCLTLTLRCAAGRRRNRQQPVAATDVGHAERSRPPVGR